MNGFETSRKIRMNKQLHDIPIIMMTAYDREELIGKSLEAGVVDVEILAFTNKDTKFLRENIHTIKGMAGNLAIRNVFAAAKNLETTVLQDTDNTLIEKSIRLFETEVDRVNISIKKLHNDDEQNQCKTTDIFAAQSLLQKLTLMVAEADLEAEDCLNALKDCLDYNQFEDNLQQLTQHIAEFDFDAAWAPLTKLTDETNALIENKTGNSTDD